MTTAKLGKLIGLKYHVLNRVSDHLKAEMVAAQNSLFKWQVSEDSEDFQTTLILPNHYSPQRMEYQPNPTYMYMRGLPLYPYDYYFTIYETVNSLLSWKSYD